VKIKSSILMTLCIAVSSIAAAQRDFTPVEVSIGWSGNREDKYILHGVDKSTGTHCYLVLGSITDEIARVRYSLVLTALIQERTVNALYWNDSPTVFPSAYQATPIWMDDYQNLTSLIIK